MGFFYNLFKNDKPNLKQKAQSTPISFPIIGNNGINWLNDSSATSFIQNGYCGNPVIYSIIKQITEKAAAVPFYLYEVKDDKKLKRYKSLNLSNNLISYDGMVTKSQSLKEVDSHKIIDLLEQPNENQSWSDFVKNSLGYKLVTGNSYIYGQSPEMGKNQGKITGITVLPSQLMNIISKNPSEVDYYNIIGGNTRIEKETICHLKYWNPDFSSGLQHYGQSPLKAALKVMQLHNTAYDAQGSILANKGAYGFLSDTSQSLDEEQLTQLKQRFKSAEANELMVASADLKFTQIGMPTEDLMILESMNLNQQDLCNIYGFPSLLLGGDDKTFLNFETAQKSLIYDTVVPELTSLRDALNKWILPAYEKADGKKYFIDFDISVLPQLAGDMSLIVEQLSKMYWITGNEKRIASKYGADNNTPLMNTYLVPQGIVPIDELSIDIDNTSNQDLSDYQ
ncbi:phage portal protein [Pedobacter immunditicola]|uniref:phage portal protein n=1 Tax=Pedobacter immunditicola TaxID=3133440 RepID=UPI0030969132